MATPPKMAVLAAAKVQAIAEALNRGDRCFVDPKKGTLNHWPVAAVPGEDSWGLEPTAYFAKFEPEERKLEKERFKKVERNWVEIVSPDGKALRQMMGAYTSSMANTEFKTALKEAYAAEDSYAQFTALMATSEEESKAWEGYKISRLMAWVTMQARAEGFGVQG
jgi:hypothetical protein